ncbi:MAG TPA: ACP S-malonyltransferase [Candidatus Enterenecus stercoripullorum]|nr:ACP S-malonyltransferase [Candidatus Enterenecus stercoripullorum]
MSLAFLYAGQGTQHPGMGADLYERYPVFRGVLDGADVGFDLKTVSFSDLDGVLNQTEYTQPCMVAFAAGMTAILYELGIRPDYAAGLSLGEYSALQAAGVFTPQQAISLVAFRGKAMAQAAQGRPCGMTAVLNLGREKLQEACRQASGLGVVEIANYNCPGQLVIGGDQSAVDTAAALAKEAGARRCLPLKVSGPFHTSLMAPAGDALRKKFQETTFAPMAFPVLFNCLGREMGPEDTIPALLERQVQSSVYLEDTIHRLAQLGVDTIVEIGPGKALSGFVRKTAPEIRTYAVETCADVEALAAALKEDGR